MVARHPGGHLTELCAGTAAVGLCALVGLPMDSLTGYMGAKRRWSLRINQALGFDPFNRCGSLHLVDAGPWGEVWSAMADGYGPVIANELRRLEDAHDDFAPAAWRAVVQLPPPAERPARVAQYLTLQARSAGCIPVWWDGDRWTAPTGSRTERAHETRPGRGSRAMGSAYAMGSGFVKSERRGAKSRGLVRLSTLRQRVEDLHRVVPWQRVTVTHGPVDSVEPMGGGAVYFDPPYRGCPRYAALLVRAEVLQTIDRWRDASRVVVVSEAEPIDGAEHVQIARREWLSVFRPAIASAA